MENRHITDQQQVLADLAREAPRNRRETSAVITPGAGAGSWPVTVTSHVSHNVYRVRAVVLQGAGTVPTEIGEQMEAINLAESFLAEGTLTPGSHAIMCRMGERNAFYAVPSQ